jgi:LysM repeat protein
MEDDDIETSSAGGLLPIALSILAIVLGGAGLYFGLTANQRLNPLADTMSEGSTSAARLEKDMGALETQVAELSAQSDELEKALGRVRLYGNQSEQAVKQLASSVRENREKIVEQVERLNELIAGQSRAAPQRTGTSRPELPAETPREEPTEPAQESASPATYTIKAGDTFAKISARLGVGLQALLDANPGVDPRRLSVGQVINVPAN